MNRIDDIIVFSELTKEELSQIVELMLKEVIKEAGEKKITLTVTDKMKEHILERGYNTKFGARPLRRAIQKYVEDALAEEIITSKINSGDLIFMDLDETSQELTVQIKKAEEPAN